MMSTQGGKAKRLPNFKLLHEREQARQARFKVCTTERDRKRERETQTEEAHVG